MKAPRLEDVELTPPAVHESVLFEARDQLDLDDALIASLSGRTE